MFHTPVGRSPESGILTQKKCDDGVLSGSVFHPVSLYLVLVITQTPSHIFLFPTIRQTGSWNTSLFFLFFFNRPRALLRVPWHWANPFLPPLPDDMPSSRLLVLYSLWQSTYWAVKHRVRETKLVLSLYMTWPAVIFVPMSVSLCTSTTWRWNKWAILHHPVSASCLSTVPSLLIYDLLLSVEPSPGPLGVCQVSTIRKRELHSSSSESKPYKSNSIACHGKPNSSSVKAHETK